MTGTIEISVDHQHRQLNFVAEGFFDGRAVTRIGEDKIACLRELGGEPTDHVSLVDVSACKIQRQEVLAAFVGLIRDERYRARRVAFVTGPDSLAKMQIRRVNTREATVRIFADRDAAQTWLSDANPR